MLPAVAVLSASRFLGSLGSPKVRRRVGGRKPPSRPFLPGTGVLLAVVKGTGHCVDVMERQALCGVATRAVPPGGSAPNGVHGTPKGRRTVRGGHRDRSLARPLAFIASVLKGSHGARRDGCCVDGDAKQAEFCFVFDSGEKHGPSTFHQGVGLLRSCGRALPLARQ